MNDFTQKPVYYSLVLSIAVVTVLMMGCRQPVGRIDNGERATLFDFNRPRIFGGNNRYADSSYSQYGNQSWGGSNWGNQNSGSRGFQQNGGTTNGGFNRGNSGGSFGNRYAAQPAPVVPEIQINDGSGGGAIANNGQNGRDVFDLNQQIGAYDADNQLLNTEVATLQQKLQLANQYNQSLKEQLAGSTSQIQQAFMERQAAADQVSNLQQQLAQANQNVQMAQQQAQQQANQFASYRNSNSAPTRLAGGSATIRANNSLLQRLSAIQIPGGQARMDGDVIRIEFPSDRMFVPGTYQIEASQGPLLQNIVGTIRDSFPRQIVGIEAHWDNSPLSPPGTTHHQLTATQSLAVFEQLVRLGLPENQLFTMAMASNRPRHPQGLVGGISPNRRIELVIYPETYDGS